MTFEPTDLYERICAFSDEELLRMVSEEADEYRPEALAIAREEIERRGISSPGPSTSEEEVESDDEWEDEDMGPLFRCHGCGSALRPAILMGESQVIAFFEDRREARFVHAHVCPKCRTADLFVDFETVVED